MNDPWNDWMLAFASLENYSNTRELEKLVKKLVERIENLEKTVNETLNRR